MESTWQDTPTRRGRWQLGEAQKHQNPSFQLTFTLRSKFIEGKYKHKYPCIIVVIISIFTLKQGC